MAVQRKNFGEIGIFSTSRACTGAAIADIGTGSSDFTIVFLDESGAFWCKCGLTCRPPRTSEIVSGEPGNNSLVTAEHVAGGRQEMNFFFLHRHPRSGDQERPLPLSQRSQK